MLLVDIPELELSAESTLTNASHFKECIYVGKFGKTIGGKRQVFDVTKEVILDWERKGNEMLADGIDIPMPEHHSEDPSSKRAEVVRFESREDSKGRFGLFIHYNFIDGVDDKTRDALKASDVSIYAPPEWTDTKGKKYSFPIRHVAFTGYPVIPGLDRTQSIIASFEAPTPEPKSKPMDLRTLAANLKIDVPENATDDEIGKLIEDFKAKPAQETTPPVSDPTPMAAGFAKMAGTARTTVIDGLVAGGHILPPVAEDLKKQYAQPEAIKLSMTSEGEINDGFDTLVDGLKKNTAVKLGETSGPQHVPDTKSPLVADALERSKTTS